MYSKQAQSKKQNTPFNQINNQINYINKKENKSKCEKRQMWEGKGLFTEWISAYYFKHRFMNYITHMKDIFTHSKIINFVNKTVREIWKLSCNQSYSSGSKSIEKWRKFPQSFVTIMGRIVSSSEWFWYEQGVKDNLGFVVDPLIYQIFQPLQPCIWWILRENFPFKGVFWSIWYKNVWKSIKIHILRPFFSPNSWESLHFPAWLPILKTKIKQLSLGFFCVAFGRRHKNVSSAIHFDIEFWLLRRPAQRPDNILSL